MPKFVLKDILNEIDNSITNDELISICSEEILLERRPLTLENFIFKIKQLDYMALPHLSFAKKYLGKLKEINLFKDSTQLNKIIKVITQMELAEYLLNQGASIKEVKHQTDIPEALLVKIVKKNYNNIPKDILRFRLINYRILKLAKQQQILFKETIVPLLSSQNKNLANALLSSFEDLIKSELLEKSSLENKLK